MSERAQRICVPAGVAEVVEATSFDATLAVVRFAVAFLEPGDRRRLAVVAGPPGTGKSAAAAFAVLNARGASRTIRAVGMPEVLVAGEFVSARWVHARELYHGIFQEKLWEAVARVTVLVVDDLGAEPKDLERVTPAIASLLCERVDAGKKTIVTTNAAPGNFNRRYGERVYDRLTGRAWYGTGGPSLRRIEADDPSGAAV